MFAVANADVLDTELHSDGHVHAFTHNIRTHAHQHARFPTSVCVHILRIVHFS